MSIKVRLRKAKLTDIPLLIILDKQAFNRDFDNAFTENEFKNLINNSQTCCFLLYEKTVPIGFYIYTLLNNHLTEIVVIAIIPLYQKRGIGTIILKMLLNKIVKNNKVKVVTHPKNSSALILYLKNGFSIAQYVGFYYGANQPRLILFNTL